MSFRIRSIAAILLAVSAAVWAAAEYSDYLAALCTRESGCNPNSINNSGYIGNYQIGEAALIDAGYYIKDGTTNNDWRGSWTGKNGINSLSDFYASPVKQAQAINDYNAKQWAYIVADGSDQYLGQTINGILMTESGLLAGAHLVGHGGLHRFLASGGTDIPKDGNKVAITSYISKFSGFNIAQISGNVTAAGNTGGSINTGNAGADINQLNLDNAIITGGTGTTTNGTGTVPSITGISIAPSVAFQSGAGLSYGDLNLAIQSIIATILLLWVSYVSWGQFKLWSEGAIPLYVMQSNMVKATTLMMFLLFIALT